MKRKRVKLFRARISIICVITTSAALARGVSMRVWLHRHPSEQLWRRRRGNYGQRRSSPLQAANTLPLSAQQRKLGRLQICCKTKCANQAQNALPTYDMQQYKHWAFYSAKQTQIYRYLWTAIDKIWNALFYNSGWFSYFTLLLFNLWRSQKNCQHQRSVKQKQHLSSWQSGRCTSIHSSFLLHHRNCHGQVRTRDWKNCMKKIVS